MPDFPNADRQDRERAARAGGGAAVKGALAQQAFGELLGGLDREVVLGVAVALAGVLGVLGAGNDRALVDEDRAKGVVALFAGGDGEIDGFADEWFVFHLKFQSSQQSLRRRIALDEDSSDLATDRLAWIILLVVATAK